MTQKCLICDSIIDGTISDSQSPNWKYHQDNFWTAARNN